MNFANQAVSLFISGIFCLVWIGLITLAYVNADYQSLKFHVHQMIAGNAGAKMLLTGCTLFLFPLAYAIGNAVNATVNTLFGEMDKAIREDAFKDESQKTGRTDITALYHEYRYKLYLSGSEMFNFLVFHREIIRILRATCFNFLMICLAMLAFIPYVKFFAFVFILYLVLSPLRSKIFSGPDIFKAVFEARWPFILIFMLLFIFLFFIDAGQNYLPVLMRSVHFKAALFLFLLSLLFSFICFTAWEKQQDDFYKTIIDAHKAWCKKNAR